MTDTNYQYIDGEWTDGQSDDEITVRDPAAPDDPIVSFPGASRAQAREAVGAAVEASDGWGGSTPEEHLDTSRSVRLVSPGNQPFVIV